MKKEKLEYTVLFVIGCAVILYIGYSFILQPQWKNFKNNIKVKKEVKQKLSNARQIINKLPILKKNIKTLQKEITKEENQLSDNEFESFVKMIKKATEKSGLTIDKIHPVNDVSIKRSKYYTEKWVRMETRVPYHVLGKWLDELEQQSDFIRIIKLSIISKKEDMGIHSANVTIGFLTKTKEK